MIKIDSIERHLFLEGILLRYGYDFRQYAEASLDRRLASLLDHHKTQSLLDLLKVSLASPEFFRTVLPTLTINTTEFFRDPLFFKSLRNDVFPTLRTYPKISIWSAGCSSGEEVISLAIALEEEGLLARSTIYATDINHSALKQAREGIYGISSIQNFNQNYVAAGGTKSPSEYYSSEYGLVRFDRRLYDKIVFSEHNLATDAVFVEANLILCRNVVIYFSRALQDHAFNLFARSLVFKGFLAIGSKESLRFSTSSPYFESVSLPQNIYSLKSRHVDNLDDGTTRHE